MTFRTTGAMERLARRLARQTGESYSEICRRAIDIGLGVLERKIEREKEQSRSVPTPG